MSNRSRCYCKNISLEEAKLAILQDGSVDGSYLIIDCRTLIGNYALLVSLKGDVCVYTIQRIGTDSFFAIDQLPPVQGLDQLIENWVKGDYPELPSLHAPCNSDQLEMLHWTDLRDGRTNNLHRAVLKGCLTKVHEMVKDQGYAVEAMNSNRQTAVHLACKVGEVETLKFLIECGASVTAIDDEGNTPLHYACSLPNVTVTAMVLLLLNAGALPIARNSKNGRHPLHEAAEADNVSVLKILLENCNVPLLPRTVDGLSPIDLARDAKNFESITYLNEFVPPPAESNRADWFHQVLSREAAELVLLSSDLKVGMFLVRESENNKGYVLTLYADRLYNYIIYEADRLWYINEGPHMPSLEHLIDYYSGVADGLPVRLMHPVSPPKVVVNLLYDAWEFFEENEHRVYENLKEL